MHKMKTPIVPALTEPQMKNICSSVILPAARAAESTREPMKIGKNYRIIVAFNPKGGLRSATLFTEHETLIYQFEGDTIYASQMVNGKTWREYCFVPVLAAPLPHF